VPRQAILGISAYYHDSAAALLVDGRIVAAAQEERFSRKRHDASFPTHACRYVLDDAGVAYDDLAAVAFYDKPFLKFERLLETYHGFAPAGLSSFVTAMPAWIKEKLFMRRLLTDHLGELGHARHRVLYPEHHLSHAASAFYPSPFDEAAILTIDGVGEWATTTIGRGRGRDIEILSELHFPHSVGLLYSAFTYYLGFTVNSGEYKLMGLAPYGHDGSTQVRGFTDVIRRELVDIRPDGSLLLNMSYFDFATGLRMVNEDKWARLFGLARRAPDAELTQPYMNLALAIQQVTEDIVLRLARTARDVTGCRHLVLAGGVALNCVANGKLLASRLFDDLWIQPAAGDAGGAVGAGLCRVAHPPPPASRGHGVRRDDRQLSGPAVLDAGGRTHHPRVRPRARRWRATSEALAATVAARLAAGEAWRVVPGAHGVRTARASATAASWATRATPRSRSGST
jgi:carbamoyltransferase